MPQIAWKYLTNEGKLKFIRNSLDSLHPSLTQLSRDAIAACLITNIKCNDIRKKRLAPSDQKEFEKLSAILQILTNSFAERQKIVGSLDARLTYCRRLIRLDDVRLLQAADNANIEAIELDEKSRVTKVLAAKIVNTPNPSLIDQKASGQSALSSNPSSNPNLNFVAAAPAAAPVPVAGLAAARGPGGVQGVQNRP